MLIIKVWCLPVQSEEDFRNLHNKLVNALVGMKKLNLKGEKDMIVLFPADLMKYGLGEVIIVEVFGFDKELLIVENDVSQQVAEELGLAVSALYPEADVMCSVYNNFDPMFGYWTSEE